VRSRAKDGFIFAFDLSFGFVARSRGDRRRKLLPPRPRHSAQCHELDRCGGAEESEPLSNRFDVEVGLRVTDQDEVIVADETLRLVVGDEMSHAPRQCPVHPRSGWKCERVRRGEGPPEPLPPPVMLSRFRTLAPLFEEIDEPPSEPAAFVAVKGPAVARCQGEHRELDDRVLGRWCFELRVEPAREIRLAGRIRKRVVVPAALAAPPGVHG
jgi:hypothetical protein